MAQMTVRQAAQQVGVSRQTMFRKIADGTVSATIDHQGQKQIDSAELLRVFGALQTPDATPATASDRPRLTRTTGDTALSPAVLVELERLRLQLEFKAAELALAQQRIDELKAREREAMTERDRLLTLLEQSSRLLAAPATPAPAIPAAAAPVPKIKSKKAAKRT